MRWVLTNAGLSAGDFNIACFFVNSAFTGCERDGDMLLLPEMDADDAERMAYYDNIGVEVTASEHQRRRATQICSEMLSIRGECKNPAGKFKLELRQNVKERYDTFVAKRRDRGRESFVLQAGDYQCPDSGYGVIAVWDTDNCFLWYEVCDSPGWNLPADEIPEETYAWCLSQGVRACESAHEANELLYEAIGHDAFISGFDESEY
jgi:hypothetical protein